MHILFAEGSTKVSAGKWMYKLSEFFNIYMCNIVFRKTR